MEKPAIQAFPSSYFILPAFRQPIVNPYLFTYIMTHTSPAAWRQKIGAVVLHPSTQLAILIIIVLNAIILGLQTSPAVVARCGALLHCLDMAALVIFIVELAAKFVALGRRFFRDGWNIFDFLVVAVALLPNAGALSVLRSLRVLRVLRLINRMPQLRRIADAILQAVPGIGAIAGLMGILFYVGAVMATTLFGERFPEWFGSLGKSLYTLFQVMTLESWSMGIVRPVMEAYPNAWLFFVPFILVSAFVMLNLFVAVIVDTMSNLHSAEPDAENRPEAPQDSQILVSSAELARLHQEIAEIKALLRERQAK